MDDLREHVDVLESSANLSASIHNVQKAVDLLTAARAKIAADPNAAPVALAKIQDPFKKTLDAAQKDLKPIYSTLNKYGKALDKKFKDKPLPPSSNDALSSHPSLINRAIAMHLLREGEFGVASTFISEALAHPPHPSPTLNTPNPYLSDAREQRMAEWTLNSEELQAQFAEMYHILHELEQRNLEPAIAWARAHREILEAQGSDLEFELCRVQFVCLYMEDIQDAQQAYNDPDDDEDDDLMTDALPNPPLRAWTYLRTHLLPFHPRHAPSLLALTGSLAYYPSPHTSPYSALLTLSPPTFTSLLATFTRTFCLSLSLPPTPPLLSALNAGALALPHLAKLSLIMAAKRTEWTTAHELPVEIPLPDALRFHSVFVCPVSKEQGGVSGNWPMRMPCGHVVARESLERLGRGGGAGGAGGGGAPGGGGSGGGGRFKCPYCPGESLVREARRVWLE